MACWSWIRDSSWVRIDLMVATVSSPPELLSMAVFVCVF